MKITLKAVEIFFINFIFFTNTSGQYVKAPGEKSSPNNIFINAGAVPEIITSVGYLHTVGGHSDALNFKMGASIKLDPLIISNGAWRSNFITVAYWKMSKHWQNAIAANIYAAHDHNREGKLTGTGFELRANPVYVGKRWSKGFDVGWQYTPFTYIKNSEAAKETFDERYQAGISGIQGPKDGWYKNAASRVRVGITGATKLGNNSELQISLGSLFVIQKQGILLAFSHAQVPACLELTYRRGW